MNLDVLQGRFAESDTPGLDNLDPRWTEVSGLVQAGQFGEAGERSLALLQEGVYDVRLIGYSCFGGFLERGPAALPEVFAALTTTLNDNWDAIGPAAARAKTAQQSLAWLFKQIHKQLQHVEQLKDDSWSGWIGAASTESVEEALSSGFLLQQALSARLESAAQALLEPLARLQAWLRSFQDCLTPVAAPPPPPEEPQAAAAPQSAAPAAAEKVTGSYHLTLLLKKIEALSKLLGANKLPAARIVADDINESLAHFDPLLYLPDLFSDFAMMMAQYATSMAELEMDPEAPGPRALRALYRANLNAFLTLD